MTSRSRPLSRLIVPLLSTGALIGLGAAPALAAGSVAVSQTSDLPAAGAQITVTGAGFDETIGIYVAVCVDNGPEQLPTPCIGGVDTSGGAGSSAWISSDPPSYAEGLTTPYGPRGSFEVTLSVVASDPKTGVDCRQVSCAVVTRADHTRTDDRSQDTRTPLTFAAADAAAMSPSQAPQPSPAASTASAPPVTGEPVARSTTAASTPAAAAPSSGASTTDAVAAADARGGGPSGWLSAGAVLGAAAVLLALLHICHATTKGTTT